MVSPTYPGVYVQEVASGVRPIAAASTSTAAFIGETERGPIGESVRVFSFTEYQNIFGGFYHNGYMGHSVFQFFNNGGASCYIVRVAGDNTIPAGISINAQNDTDPSILVSASSDGVWGNELSLVITEGTSFPNELFNIEIYERDNIKPSEILEDLSMDENSPNYCVTKAEKSTLIRIAIEAVDAENENDPDITGLNQSEGISRSGGAISFPEADEQFAGTHLTLSINGDQARAIDLSASLPEGGPPPSLAELATVITAAVSSLSASSATVSQLAYDNFTVQADTDANTLTLRSGTQGAGSSVVVSPTAPIIVDDEEVRIDLAPSLNLGLSSGGVEFTGAAEARPSFNDLASAYLVGDHVPASSAAIRSVILGTNGSVLTGDLPFTNALQVLDNRTDVSLICIPGKVSPSLFGSATAYCENRALSDCFFIGDTNQDFNAFDQLQEEFVAQVSPKNSYGAAYTPWALMEDPTGQSAEPIAVPPCGFVAGLYAKTDAQRGVWKAAAGTAAGIAGSIGLNHVYTDKEHGLINPAQVNVIREFAGAGRVLWGARVMSSDPGLLYINVRRMMIFLRVSTYNGIQWAVFEPNDQPLWDSLKLNINAFMNGLFRRGAFQGAKASDAFFVKVDNETTTQDDIDAGRVNIQVGFAPLKPAEFVVVELSQKAGQA